MIFSFFYNLALVVLAIVASPKILYQYFVQGKYVDSLPQKFGVNLPEIVKGDRLLIWIHAVSVGEAKAMSSLVKTLKKEHDNVLIVISSTTETGHAEAKRCLACADYHLYLPLDFSWIIGPYIRRTVPDLVILSESDFWYNFLKASKQCGAKVAIVNGKMSRASAKNFSLMRFFSKRLFSLVDIACLQSEHYWSRFIDSGLSYDKLVVTGNLKLDDEYPEIDSEELEEWKKKLGIDQEDKVIVIGSTHAPEEEQLLTAMEPIWRQNPSLKVVLVPRHPERFDAVANLLEEKNIPFTRLSAPKQQSGDEVVILIDAMGLLRRCYQFADIAIVAGSYTSKVGGHNIVEPCWYGVPTIFGPHMETQPELVKLVKKYQAGVQVDLKGLPGLLIDLLNNESDRKRLGNAGVKLAQNSRGATRKTYENVRKILSI